MQPKLVIRTYAPARRYLLVGGALIFGLLSLYVAYEFGRSGAGYDSRAAMQQRGDLNKRIRELEELNREQRVQLASQEGSRIGQTRERAEVSRTIGELQAQVARQEQDLAFYRGVVGESAQAPLVKVQQFRVIGGSTAGAFALKLVLGRPVRPEDAVNGTIGITVEGSKDGMPVSFELAQLTHDKLQELRFNFRYLQTLDQDVTLPADFKPERTTVEVRINRKGVQPTRQSFLWTAESI